MALGLYLLIGLFAASPDTTVPGIPVAAALQIMHPMVTQRSLVRNAILLAMVNRSRSEAGLTPLQWDNRLAEAAHEHAHLMSAKGELSHQFPGEPDLANRLSPKLRLDQAGENVFYDDSLEDAHEAFMKSPHHRANLLNPAYDSIGIGIVELAGVLYIVEDFAHRVPELSNENAASQVVRQFAKLRQAAGADELQYQQDEHLENLACSMAEHDSLDGKIRMSLLGVRVAAFYATTDPTQLPANVARLSALNGVGRIGVGVCYARTPKYPTGLYWVSFLLFQDPSA